MKLKLILLSAILSLFACAAWLVAPAAAVPPGAVGPDQVRLRFNWVEQDFIFDFYRDPFEATTHFLDRVIDESVYRFNSTPLIDPYQNPPHSPHRFITWEWQSGGAWTIWSETGCLVGFHGKANQVPGNYTTWKREALVQFKVAFQQHPMDLSGP